MNAAIDGMLRLLAASIMRAPCRWVRCTISCASTEATSDSLLELSIRPVCMPM